MEVIRVGSLANDGASSTFHSFMILNFCSVENKSKTVKKKQKAFDNRY